MAINVANLFEVLIVQKESRKIVGGWLVQAESMEAADKILHEINAMEVAEGDKPIIPSNCLTSIAPVEFERGVFQTF